MQASSLSGIADIKKEMVEKLITAKKSTLKDKASVVYHRKGLGISRV
jgi:hypothetical protein